MKYIIGRCIDNYNYQTELTIGKLYILSYFNGTTSYVTFVSDKNKIGGALARRFKISSITTTFTKLKIL